ncbi:unnamed protein product [Calypogeia fissa]
MTTPGEDFPGAGLWSMSGKGSPRPSASQIILDQVPVGQVITPHRASTAIRAQPKGPNAWSFLYTCNKCCVCCGYDFCAKCCCPCTCCRCCYWLFIAIILFILVVGLVVVALWKILHPKLPTFNVDNANFSYSVTNGSYFNLTSPPTSYILNAQTVFVMETTNPNTAIGIYYDQIKFHIQLFSLVIGDQIIPPFYDGFNVTKYINGNMTSGPLTLNTANQVALAAAVNASSVPLNLDVGVKVRVGIGHLYTPQLKVQLNCVVNIDPGASSGSQMKGMNCGFSFKL